MVGGEIVQVIGNRVEVLDGTYFDRQWRHLPDATDVFCGDLLWWQNWRGYLSRRAAKGFAFEDRDIGRCLPSVHPATAKEVSDE